MAAALVAAILTPLVACPAAAQNLQHPFSHELFYTVSGSEDLEAALRSVRVSGADVRSLALTDRQTIATFPGGGGAAGNNGGAAGLIFAPDGDLLVSGAANRIFKVQLPDGAYFAFQAGPGYFSGEPTVLRLVGDPAADRAWALSSEPMITGVGLLPGPSPGAPAEVYGLDPKIRSLAWVPGGGFGPRVLYTAGDPGGVGVRHLGRIDMATMATTRLVNNLPAARAMVLDPFTGKLILFGGSHITQLNADPVVPVVESDLDLSTLRDGFGIDLVDGTPDGQGRLFAVSSDGRLVVLDYSSTRRVATAVNHLTIVQLEPRPVIGGGGDGSGEIRGLAPLVGPGRRQLAYCLWDNGNFDRRNSQASQVSDVQGDPQVADDVYLEPGSIHRLDTINATLITNSLAPKARLTIYEDCDGSPGALRSVHESFELIDTGTDFGGFDVYTAVFTLGGLHVDAGRDGLTLWISVQGVGLGAPDEEWYWGTAGNLRVKGTPARFRSPALGNPDWTSIDQSGCGCTDFAFSVVGEACKVLHHNGGPDLLASPAGSLSQIAGSADSARSSDNFVIPPCPHGSRARVCYLKAYIYSNCDPVRGRFEVYDNECKSPVAPGGGGGRGGPDMPLYAAPFTRVSDLGYTREIDGEILRAYCVETVGLDWYLPTGLNYWLAAVGDTTFAQSKRAYFAYSDRCGREGREECRIDFSPAMAVGQGVGRTQWTRLMPGGPGRDLAFTIAVSRERPPTLNVPDPACEADVDRSGTVTVQDLFDFLGFWFAGCP